MNMSVQTVLTCPLCRSVDVCRYRSAGGYSIVRCTQCSLLFVNPVPTAAELTAFYQQAAYYESSSLGYTNYMGDRARHEQLARERLRRIERLRPERGRILDVGCAAGFFLHVAQSRGWDP